MDLLDSFEGCVVAGVIRVKLRDMIIWKAWLSSAQASATVMAITEGAWSDDGAI